MMRRARNALALAVLAIGFGSLAPGTVVAQRGGTWEVVVDNDAFDFWVPPGRRPDHDYTHGMWIAAELDRAPVWGRALRAKAAPCTGRESSAQRCLRTRFELGQKLYTPVVDSPTPLPGERAYAGWLYVAATGGLQDARERTWGTVELGVTGPESLGEAVHQGFHRLAGFWSPDGWRNQLSFEPAVSLRLGREMLAVDARHGATRIATIVPSASVALGNLRTDAQAGVHARVGRGVPHPWTRAGAGSPRFAAYVTVGGRGDWVLHDLLLDGNSFAKSVRVARRPLVAQAESGVGLRWKRVTGEYRVTTRGSEYRTQPGSHAWSTLALTVAPH
ncbi:MAG TPA: lipid A deacylase LpxR family protein [Longimicrobiaceae bacterium]|nr:lipid A deacylase LpxR family protein [Longimicrobiaceae bacterium]